MSAHTRTTRKVRRQEMRTAILDAALRLIIENGADRLSLREIARSIDHSPAGLYEYFDGKAEIIQAVRLEALKRFDQTLRRVPRDLPFDQYIVRLGQQYIQFAREAPQQFLLLFTHRRSDIDATPEEQETSAKSYALLHDAVKDAIDEGLIQAWPHYRAREAAFSFWSVVHGMAMMEVSYPRRLDIDYSQTEEITLRALVRGLAAD